MSAYYLSCTRFLSDLPGCYSTPEGELFAAALDGQDGASWHLPLPPLNATSTPEAYSPGENPPVDRLAAAARLVRVGAGTCAVMLLTEILHLHVM